MIMVIFLLILGIKGKWNLIFVIHSTFLMLSSKNSYQINYWPSLIQF